MTRPVSIAILMLLIAIGVARVIATYPSVSVTYDEPWHLAGGMERLQFGTYTYETMHPPLARVAVALGPFLAGARLATHRDVAKEGENVLFQEGTSIYYRDDGLSNMLVLSRLGTLVFLVLTCVVTFLWGERWFSPETGLIAVGLLICTPPILGHSGVATNDMACAAGTMAALYQLLRWFEPDSRTVLWSRTGWFAVALAFAFLCKFSSVAFICACCAVTLLLRWKHVRFSGRWKSIASIIGIVFVLMWACYGFTLKPLETVWGAHPRVDAMLANHPAAKPLWNAAMSMPLPLTEVIIGARDVARHNALGHDSYLLGEYRSTGWWYFFLVVLAVKTPIGLLLLALGGWLVIFSNWNSSSNWSRVLTAIFPLAILAVCMASGIDLGVRHILPIYPLLALLGGHLVAVSWSNWRSKSLFAVGAVSLLCAWAVIDSVRAQPDYLAYFNQFAGQHPEKILAESDLDWGQDLGRLSTRLKELNVTDASIAYFGSALLEKSGLPSYHTADPRQPSRGYVAVSLHRLTIDYAKDGSYGWLKDYTPRERVGKSIDLFYIP